MDVPEGWKEMTGTEMAVVDYTVPVTVGTLTASFSFRVFRQPSSGGNIITLTKKGFERYTLTFIVADKTDYDATGNPATVFTTALTSVKIRAIRSLVMGGTTMIPKPGTLVNYGGANSFVDSVDIAQNGPTTSDVFLVTCHVQEDENTWRYEQTPKTAKSDDLPPWQLPADWSFETRTGEGMTLGFAYPAGDLDGKLVYAENDLRNIGVASSSKMVAVENYANDPFSSPPSIPKTTGTLRVTKAMLRSKYTATGAFRFRSGRVNDSDFVVSIGGADIMFLQQTLSPDSVSTVPKLHVATIPWFNKTKHPLNKTYGELFYGYSGASANIVAFNSTGETILVKKPVRYLEVSATFTYRVEGFAVWLANRGYTELDDNSPDGRSDIAPNGKTKEAWLDKYGKLTKDERIWRGFTTVTGSPWVKQLLDAMFTEENAFPWATEQDNYGARIT